MEKDLKMEVFASVDTVKPVEFHVYELHVQKIGNTYSIIRGAAWKLRNWNQAGVFEDGNKMRLLPNNTYTSSKTDISNLNAPAGSNDVSFCLPAAMIKALFSIVSL